MSKFRSDENSSCKCVISFLISLEVQHKLNSINDQALQFWMATFQCSDNVTSLPLGSSHCWMQLGNVCRLGGMTHITTRLFKRLSLSSFAMYNTSQPRLATSNARNKHNQDFPTFGGPASMVSDGQGSNGSINQLIGGNSFGQFVNGEDA